MPPQSQPGAEGLEGSWRAGKLALISAKECPAVTQENLPMR